MIITATLEGLAAGTVETTEVACQEYKAGFEQLRRTTPEGCRLLSVRVAR